MEQIVMIRFLTPFLIHNAQSLLNEIEHNESQTEFEVVSYCYYYTS
jgi:hypothetical protein